MEPDFMHAEDRVKELENEIEKKNSLYLESLGQIKILNEKIQELNQVISNKSIENNLLKTEVLEHSNFLQELAQLRNQNEALLGQRALLSKKIETLQVDYKDLQEKCEKERSSNHENFEKIEEENKRLKQQIQILQEEKKDDGSSLLLKQAQEDVIKYRQQCDTLAGNLSRMQAQLRKNK